MTVMNLISTAIHAFIVLLATTGLPAQENLK
jgi:hypothetical protein